MAKTDDHLVAAVEVAKEKPGLSNEEKRILNKIKILLLDESVKDADTGMVTTGKIKNSTLEKIRNLAESVIEDWVRGYEIDEVVRDKMISDVKFRAHLAEEQIMDELRLRGLLIEN